MLDVFALTDQELSSLWSACKAEQERRTVEATTGQPDPIYGLEYQKRALVVAATGKHTVALIGSPGSGKTLLRRFAKRLGVPATFEAWPCQCGYIHSPGRACTCTVEDVRRFRLNVWPTAEIWVEVIPAPAQEFGSLGNTPFAYYSKQVDVARALPATKAPVWNKDAVQMLRLAQNELGLTHEEVVIAQSVAVSCARLDGHHSEVRAQHACEAVQYRPQCRNPRN